MGLESGGLEDWVLQKKKKKKMMMMMMMMMALGILMYFFLCALGPAIQDKVIGREQSLSGI